jgi:hypothetical protein
MVALICAFVRELPFLRYNLPLVRIACARLLLLGLLIHVPQAFAASYAEDFSDGQAQGWQVTSGTWTVSSTGTYDSSANQEKDLATYSGATWANNFVLHVDIKNPWPSSGNQPSVVFNYQDADNYYKATFSPSGTALLTRVIAGSPSDAAPPQSWPVASSWYGVDVIRVGSATTIRVNGAAIFRAVTQTELGAGRIGVATRFDNAQFRNVSVADLSYGEDFSDGQAQSWAVTNGTWSVGSGSYNSSANQSADISTYSAATWSTDFTYHVDINNPWPSSGNRPGLVYNYQDASNYYRVNFGPDGTARLTKVINGAETDLLQTWSPVVNAWYDVDVIRSGSTTTVKVNGAPIFSSITQSELGPGRIGVFTRSDNAKFDNIWVTGVAGNGLVFPRIAGLYTSGPFNYGDSTYQAQIATRSLAILNFWTGWSDGTGQSIQDIVRAIKGHNANANMLIGNYTMVEEGPIDAATAGSSGADIYNKLVSGVGAGGNPNSPPHNDWFARDTAGNQLSWWPSQGVTNVTSFVTPDANGDRYPAWFAKRENTVFFDPIPEFDIWYSDNVFHQPRVDADWNRDGSPDLATTPSVQTYYRQGLASYISQADVLKPALMKMGNVDGDGSAHIGYLTDPEYTAKLGGALLEGAAGRTWTEEAQRGWDSMMWAYRSLMDNTKAPHAVLFQLHATTTGKAYDSSIQPNYGGGSNYAFIRYGIASALMEDGYVSIGVNGSYHDVVQFDEFNVPLGLAIDGPQRTPYQSGVYVRRFAGGLAIVNPRSNPGSAASNRAAVNITIPTSWGLFKRFSGTQDSATNNGQNLPLNGSGVPNITIPAGDGIILIRQ